MPIPSSVNRARIAREIREDLYDEVLSPPLVPWYKLLTLVALYIWRH